MKFLLKYIILFAFVILAFSVDATVYYVSSSTGDDSNSGTSEELPWKSLAKVNYFFRLEPGDQVLFKRGDEWSGTLQVNGSGTQGSPIVFGAYGAGEKPKIYGSELITGWTLHSGNIYKAKAVFPVSQLFIDEERGTLARYPDSGYFYVDYVSTQSIFTCNDLNSGINYSGAICHIRNYLWDMSHDEVSTSNNRTIYLRKSPYGTIKRGNPFFLNNKLEFLTQAGEWYFDKATSTVYLWTPEGGSPENYQVRGSTFDNSVYIEGRDFVVIDNLEILQTKSHSVYARSSNNLSISNCDIHDADGYGIHCIRCVDALIDSNMLTGSMGDGIYVSNENISNKGPVTITNNTIKGVARFSDIGVAGIYYGNSIFTKSDDVVIQHNRILDAGYNGIQFYGQNSIVEYNFIDGYCQTLADGGGIYSWVGQSNNVPLSVNSKGSVVRRNIVINGNGDGTGYQENYNNDAGTYGIYLDEASEDVLVEENTVARSSGHALLYHQTIGIVARNNVLFDNPKGFRDSPNIRFSKDNKFTKNTVYNIHERQHDENFVGIEDQLVVANSAVSTIVMDSNVYVDRNQSNVFFDVNSNRSLEFEAWKGLGQDGNSDFIGIPLDEGETEQLFYNDTKQNKTFNLGTAVFKDIYGNEVTGKLILEPFTSKILIGKDFLGINQNPVILDQSFNISSPVLRDDIIGNVVASDPDPGQVVRYSIINGEETDWLSIDSISGEIYANTVFQTSSDILFEFLVQAKDDAEFGLTDTATIVVYVKGEPLLKPQINSFVVPDVVMRLTIPVNSFVAESSNGIAGYLLTETSQEPSLEDAGWTSVSPEEYTFSSAGTYKLYAWVKDSAGNISEPFVVTVAVILPDLSPVYSEYLFEEGAGNDVIDSEGSNDGILVNEAVRTSGASGMGLQFSGSGHVSLGECFGENVQEEVTMSAWLRPAASSSGYQGIVMHGGPNTDSYALYIYPNTKTIGFKTSGTTSSWFSAGGVEELWDGNWHHVAVTYNGSEKVIYVDNVAIATISATGSIDSGYGYNLLIGAGRDEEVPTLLYEGILDEVRIYNYALTASAIGDLYHPVNRELNKIATEEEVTICEGSEYMGWTETGEYERTLQRVLASASGADSVVTTTLYVTPGYTVTETATVCEGETYTFGGQTLTESGEYTEVFSAQSGCDSTVVLTLTVNPIYNIVEDITIAEEGNYKGWDTEGTYTRILESIGGCDSIVTTNLSIEQKVTQFIELKKGWNIFSSYVIPNNKNMESVTEKLRMEGNLVRVQDESGNTYEEWSSTEGWSNKIGNLLETEGYKILVHSPSVLKVEGKKVAFPLEIKLKKGMNIIPFPFEVEADAANVFQPLIDAQILEKVQDESGRSLEYWKSIGWLNGIGSLIPGEGYIVHVSDDGNIWFNQAPVKLAYIYAANSEPVFFSVDYEDNGFAHMNINVIGLNESGLSVGDEVAIYDNTVCVGAVKLAEWNFELNVVSIPASSSDNFMEAGFDEGNPIIFKVWKGWKNETVQFSPSVIDGELEFSRYASLFVSFENLISLSEDIEIYPNPANNIVFVRFPALPEEGAQISLLDLSGKELSKHIVSSNLEKLNVESFPAGLYFLKVSVRNRTSMHKLVIA
ncbi:LamG-like jellyroll fold domain-containing protein [Mariniphaga anaerophila]|nr:LamG-like jellyroll fold domain-containing protein [Mariniphaga anaerophila]